MVNLVIKVDITQDTKNLGSDIRAIGYRVEEVVKGNLSMLLNGFHEDPNDGATKHYTVTVERT